MTLEKVGLDMPTALGILDTYIQDFEHYIGDIGTQIDVIRKALRGLFPLILVRRHSPILL